MTVLKSVKKYNIASLIKAIIHGVECPAAANIYRQFVNLAATQFNFRKRIATNIEKFATLVTKLTQT